MILVVDDVAQNVRLLEAVLTPHGHAVATASSGEEALDRIAAGGVELVLLDIVMPGMDGYEVCRRLRADEATRFLPVVTMTASGDHEKRRALEAGADDFVTKPFDQAELLARVGSLLRIKRYHDTITTQTAELEEFSRRLEQRVAEQVEELERMRRLRRFLAPQVADLVVSSGDESFLESHRREITVLVCDLRGFSAFAEAVEPEEVMEVLREYHAGVGEELHRFEATLDRFSGGRVMAYLNDPLPCSDAPERAVRMAVAVRNRVWELAEGWSRSGYDLHLAIGIAHGHATLGRVGFEGRWEYGAIGSVTLLAERLSEAAEPGQIVVSRRVHSAAEAIVIAQPLGELALPGFARPTDAYDVVGLVS